MPTSVELRQRRASLWEEAKSLHTLADKEKRQLTAEEREQWDRINGEIDSLKITIDRLERIDAIDEEMSSVPEPRSKPNPDTTNFDQQGMNYEEDDPESPLPASREYGRAFGAYLRHGLGGMKPDLRAVLQPYYGAVSVRALQTTTGAAGGATVPEEFYRRLLEAMLAFGGMRQARTTKITTSSGATMPIPLVDDTHNEGAILAEGSDLNLTGTDPSFGSKDLGAHMYTSKIVRISIQLLQDSAFGLEGWLAGALGARLGRITNRHFTTGSGDGQPEGIVTACGEGVTDASLTMDYTDLVDLEHSVDPAYRSAGAEWMFHDTSLSKLKQMKDDDERPIWLPGVAVGAPDTILGYSYIINQAMAQAVAGAKAILFGDFSYYFIRDVMDLRVLRLEEKFAEYLQVGFLAFLRTDGLFATPSEVEDTANVPVKYLQFAGSSSP
jgi:HK97 family phage major capsid protein